MKTVRQRVVLGAVIVFCVCSLYVCLWLNGLAYQRSFTVTPQANITLIAGPAIPSPDLGLLMSVTPTSTYDPLLSNGTGIQPGSYVQITGTGGSGLNIRNSPELSGNKNFIAGESEVFLVIGGPVNVDGYNWWQLSAPYDEGRQGWAVEDFLHLISP